MEEKVGMKSDNWAIDEEQIPCLSEEDIVFDEAYEEFIKNHKKNETILWEKIKDLTNENLHRYYRFAVHFYTYERDLDKVLFYLEKAFDRYKQKIPKSVKIEIMEIPNKELICQKKVIARCYMIAAEVYSIRGDLEKSLKCYQNYHYIQSLDEKKIKEQNTIRLYSFRSINKYTLADLVNKTITVCHPSMMNDPLDSPVMEWSTKENLDKICNEKTHIEPYSRSYCDFRIRSFSRCSLKKSLMWSHYADEHKGFCIKYRLSKHFINEEGNVSNKHMFLKKIKYTSQKVNILENSIDITLGFATKHRNWKYENEVRLISYNPNVDGKFYSINLDDDSDIEAIYFGCKCDESDMKTIKNICDKIYKNIKYYKMRINLDNIYNLNKDEYKEKSSD